MRRCHLRGRGGPRDANSEFVRIPCAPQFRFATALLHVWAVCSHVARASALESSLSLRGSRLCGFGRREVRGGAAKSYDGRDQVDSMTRKDASNPNLRTLAEGKLEVCFRHTVWSVSCPASFSALKLPANQTSNIKGDQRKEELLYSYGNVLSCPNSTETLLPFPKNPPNIHLLNLAADH